MAWSTVIVMCVLASRLQSSNVADTSQPADLESGTSLAVTVGENSESIELYHERQRTRFCPSTNVVPQRTELVRSLSDIRIA